MDFEQSVPEDITAVDPDLAIALAAEVADADAQLHADAIGLPDLSALDLF